MGIVTTSSETAFSHPAERHLAIAMRPKLFVLNSVGRLGHDRDDSGGLDGRMTIEAYKDAPLPDAFFRIVNPANIDAYHAAVARELA